MIKDGNSIFILEIAGLCIGHLGHLHTSSTTANSRLSAGWTSWMVAMDGTTHVSRRRLGNHQAPARLGVAADAPLRHPLDEFMRLIGQQFAMTSAASGR